MAQLPPPESERLTILVVDPTPVARQSLLRRLDARGHVALGAGDVDEAGSRLGTEAVDVVLADWPSSDPAVLGLIASLRAREADGAAYTAVALLTSPSGRLAVPAAVDAGADGHLARPIDDAGLDAVLPVLARLVRLERANRILEIRVRQQDELLREEVRRDPLTLLGNRLRLDEDLRRIRGRAQRYGHRAGAVMLGVDQLRRYQDAAGSTAADALVRRVAGVVRECLRDGDTAYRFTADQLLVLLPEQDEAGAIVVAERCRTRVAAMGVEHRRSDAADVVTLSAGVAELAGTGRDATEAWLRHAEQALEAARAAGGNRTIRGGNTHVAGVHLEDDRP